MRSLRSALPLLLPLALCGCSAIESAVAPGTPAAAGTGTVTQQSVQNGRFVALIGPSRQLAAPFLGVPHTNYYALRSWIDTRNGDVATQIYVEDSYVGDERSYDASRSGDGQPLTFAAISRNKISCEDGCSYAEEFAADLPAQLLEAHSENGLTVTFTARVGPDLTIAVPGELIAQQLAAIAAAAGRTKPAAAAMTFVPRIF